MVTMPSIESMRAAHCSSSIGDRTIASVFSSLHSPSRRSFLRRNGDRGFVTQSVVSSGPRHQRSASTKHRSSSDALAIAGSIRTRSLGLLLAEPCRRLAGLHAALSRSHLPTMAKVSVKVLSAAPRAPPSRLKRCLKPMAALAVAIAVVALVHKFARVQNYLHAVDSWIKAHKVPGMAILPLLICLTLPLGFPCSLFEVAAGSLFGVPVGAVLSVVGKTTGGVLAFTVGRHLLRTFIRSYLENCRVFHGMCEVLQSCDWKLLLLVQLSGLPNALKCYGLALTEVSTWKFVATAFAGGIPHALVWAFVGKQAQDLLSADNADATADSAKTKSKKPATPQLLLLIGSILLTLVALAALSFFTKKQMQKHQNSAKIAAISSPVASCCSPPRSASETESVTADD